VPESLVAGKTVALVLPSLGPEHMRDIIRGVKDGLGDDSFRLLLQVADSDYRKELQLLEGLTDALVAGAIVYPPPYAKYAKQLAELVQGRQLPTVLVDTELPGVEVDAVTTHREQLGRKAMEHLVNCGHSRIGILDKSVDSTSEELMRQGMAQVLEEGGINFAALPRVRVPAGRGERAASERRPVRAVREFLNEHPDLSAVVACDEGLGMRCIRLARELDLSIPQDLSLVVINDSRTFEILDPPVTAVRQPHFEIGEAAAKRLLQRLDGDTSPAQSSWLRPELIERGSVRTLSEE
jgi:LacI family transcriptional regulator